MNRRANEIRVAATLGLKISESLINKSISQMTLQEKSELARKVKGVSLVCSGYADLVHGYSVGIVEESEIPPRAQVFSDESTLLGLIAISGGACLGIEGFSERELTAELSKLTPAQRVKMSSSLNSFL
jgi:hypothetical protein